MAQSNNQPTNQRNMGHNAGPQVRPRSPSDYMRLENVLESSYQWNEALQQQVADMSERNTYQNKERQRLCFKVHNLRYQIKRLEGLMELREREFKAELKKNIESISSYQTQISDLEKNLEFQTAQGDLCKQEKDNMAASLEAEKQKVSKQNDQMLKLKSENQNSFLLQNQLQEKVNQMEQLLHQKDEEILDLRKEKNDLSQKLTDALHQQSRNEAWQTKYNHLQESFRQELEDNEQSWKTRVEQVEEEKKELQELCLKLKVRGRGFLPRKKWIKTRQTKVHRKRKGKKVVQKDETDKTEKDGKDSLYHKLREITSQLKSQSQAFLQNDKAWQTKYNALEEKFTEKVEESERSCEERLRQVERENKELKERIKQVEEANTQLEQREHNWRERIQQVEETNKELQERENNWKEVVKQVEAQMTELENISTEITEKKKKKRRFWSLKKIRKTKEEKRKVKRDKEMKKVEKQEKKERKKREKKEKREMKKKAKKEKKEMKSKEQTSKVEMAEKPDEKEGKMEITKEDDMIEIEVEMTKTENEKNTVVEVIKTDNSQMMEKKKKKGLLSWIHKKKKSDGDRKVEEAAGCSAQDRQQ